MLSILLLSKSVGGALAVVIVSYGDDPNAYRIWFWHQGEYADISEQITCSPRGQQRCDSTPSMQPSTATTMRSRGCCKDEQKPSKWKVFTAGIIRENPVLRLVLGCCSALAVTTTVSGAVGMGLAMTFVLVCSNIVISALRKVIPAKVHLPCYIVIIATFVTVVQMVLQAFIPDLYKALGVYPGADRC